MTSRVTDCPDGEDEDSCSNTGRPESSTTPASSSSVTSTEWVTGLSTERRDSVCLETEFQCREKHFCIHAAWICDGDRDCPDGSDEVNRRVTDNIEAVMQLILQDEGMCADRRVVCSAAEFSCSSGLQCLSADQACDGRSDCRDGSDEEECGARLGARECDKQTEFNCGNNKEGEPQCISVDKVGLRLC